MNTFFVVGLPRSRTAWLANLFTWGRSFCFHEAIKRCEKSADLREEFDRICRESPISLIQVGDSDSGLLTVWRDIMDYFPEARWLHVKRNWKDAAYSFLSYFDGKRERLYEGIELDSKETWVTFQKCSLMEGLFETQVSKMGWGTDKYLKVPFNELTNENTARKVWDFIMPDEPWCKNRWKELESYRVNVIPEKVGELNMYKMMENIQWPQ